MIAAVLRFELRLPDVQSLKAKRGVIRPLVEGLRRKVSVSVSEVEHHDSWQRSAIAVAVVTSDMASMDAMIDRILRYVEDQVEIEVLDTELSYLETER